MTGEPSAIIVAALYKFVGLTGLPELRERLASVCRDAGVRGTLLLAPEGINGTIAASRRGLDRVLSEIRALPGCEDLDWKESRAHRMPFKRMKVRLKREIVALGRPSVDPTRSVGTYVEPKDWNALITEPGVLVVDTRNDYEVAIGTFEGANNPNTQTFGEFPGWVDTHLANTNNTKIAMFCTGGIRCEKATALLKDLGFEEVYHLKGGILKYLEEVPATQSLWRGECFVFDERVSVGQDLRPGPYQLCSTCRQPWHSGADGGGYSHTPCPTCEETADDERKRSAAERSRQIALAERRGRSHIGPRADQDE